MGCAGSTHNKAEENVKKLKRPKAWKHTQPLTMVELRRMRDEFWDTQPHYGGQKVCRCLGRERIPEVLKKSLLSPWSLPIRVNAGKSCEFLSFQPRKYDVLIFIGAEIWDALRAAAESTDLTHAQAIVDGAGIIVSNADLTTCYDERGAKYDLPKYVLSEPTNLIRDRCLYAANRKFGLVGWTRGNVPHLEALSLSLRHVCTSQSWQCTRYCLKSIDPPSQSYGGNLPKPFKSSSVMHRIILRDHAPILCRATVQLGQIGNVRALPFEIKGTRKVGLPNLSAFDPGLAHQS
ncbi:hypothetical protein Taro_018526 [Colocasia esculenta]|uniref:DC-UbP/UBTD2 N-terminal domain-containing protein n=1 Tax=Colocasia esculenta TaxID=4460 RepID=A0A843UU31_COLES|nr:hypothetical protein [Colocasia esculenta]